MSANEHSAATVRGRARQSPWTPADGDCSAAPATAGLGGAAPYWLTDRFEVAGNRTQRVRHDADASTAGGDRLIRRHGTVITDHQPSLTAIAEELNVRPAHRATGERPRHAPKARPVAGRAFVVGGC